MKYLDWNKLWNNIKPLKEPLKDCKVKEARRLYCEANKDKIKAYYEANKDKIKARSASYYEANKDKIKKQKLNVGGK